MLSLDATTIRELAPAQNGQRAERQHEIIEGMGTSISATLDNYDINTPLRIAHFLAQVAHESDGFCTTEEYASGLAYEGRKDLGNLETNDGPRYKGRGLIQLTGRANYRSVGSKLGRDLENNPFSVSDPYIYLLVSCEFWKERGINQHCDADDILSVTHIVNGGIAGLDSRKAYLAKAKALVASLGAGDVEPPGGGMPVLHLGSTGDAVTMLQKCLSAIGYPVALDGEFGPAVEVSVKHFQAGAGLVADGIVGAKTWVLMQAAKPGD